VPLLRWAGVVVLVGAFAALPQVAPDWTAFFVMVGIFYLAVQGLSLLTGWAGQISLGQTAFMAVGGYGGGLLSLRLHWPPALAALVAAVASAALAVLLGTALLRLRGYYLALATLGLSVMTEGLATGLVDLTGGPSGLVGVPNLGFGEFVISDPEGYYYLLLVACSLGAWIIWNISRSQTGRAFSAIAVDQHAAAALGINAASFKTVAFVLSAVFASVAGSVYASYFRFYAPDLVSVTVAFSLVVMLALGGSRSLLGPLLGAFFLRVIPQADLLLPRGSHAISLWEPLIAGVLLILVITYLPTGLWGGGIAVWRRVRP
jgi:branched-chain amino acid transport system permease protein